MNGTRPDRAPASELPLGRLLKRIVDEGAAFGEAQVGMAYAELQRDLGEQARRLLVAIGGMLLLLSGLQLVVVALVLAAAARLDAWLAALIVAAPLLVAGSVVLLMVRSPLGAPFLRETRGSLKESRRWLSDLQR